MKIKWEIDDGYVGKSRPHFCTIPDEEFEGCESERERNEIIDSWVQTEFENNISYYWVIDE